MQIPLYRPDLTTTDAQRVMAVLQQGHDPTLLTRWEAAWGQHWQRHCLAFSDEREAWRCLRLVMGWPTVMTDALISPRWLEAAAAQGIQLLYRDVEAEWEGEVAFVHHAFGVPHALPHSGFVLEELSGLLLPHDGVGGGDVQLMHFHGMLQAGSSCVLLTRQEGLFRGLGQVRRGVPGAAVCAMGLAQLARLEETLQRRAWLASRYETMLRDGKGCRKPPVPGGGRVWEWYLLHCDSEAVGQDLAAFLGRGGIAATSPIWQRLPANLTGAIGLQQRVLALPLYAALSEGEQKRVINRYHRWRQH